LPEFYHVTNTIGVSPPTSSIHGVLPVIQLPYHDDEQIDFETLGREIDWLFDAGSDGLVMAMVSEVLRLSDQERLDVAAYICQHSAGRGSITISVGAESSRQAEAFTANAESVGASAVMAVPPVSIAVDETQLRTYYERILAATRLPVIVQDASGYVGRPMSIEFQASLWRDHPRQVMFKPEATPIGPRLTALHEATGGQAAVFEGTGGVALVESYRRRISGTMPGADLIHAIVALWRALESDDTVRIDAISMPLITLVTKLHSLDAFIAIEKHLLVRQGVFQNTVIRGPVGYTLDDVTRQEVDRLFDVLHDVVKEPQRCN
jgi:dihydrodipicolinate synthase/N-acetylneuraminate lyase